MPNTMRLFLMCAASLTFVNFLPAEDRVQYLRNVEVKQSEKTEDVVCIGCSVLVTGRVEGDVVAVGGDVEIAGTVEGDAVAAGGRILLRPGATVEGDAVAVGGSSVQEGNASVHGEVETYPYFHIPGQRSLHPLGVLTFAGVNALLALAGGLVIRRRRSDNMAKTLRVHPWLALFSGLILITLWALLWLVDSNSRLVTTTVWIGHSLAMVCLFSGCVGFAWAAGALLAGRWTEFLKWPAGAITLSVPLLIPVLGCVLFLAVLVIGLGTACASGLGKDPDWLSGLRLRRGKLPGTPAESGESGIPPVT